MAPDKSIELRFSAAANTYDNHSSIQEIVAEKLCRIIPHGDEKDNLKILEIGCGTGILTEHLATMFKKSTIDALDISENMVNKSKAKLNKFSNIRFFVADFTKFNSTEKYDIIVSSSSLHWIKPLSLAFNNIYNLLKPRGTTFFSMMLSGTFFELSYVKRCVVPNKSEHVYLPDSIGVEQTLELCRLKSEFIDIEDVVVEYPSAVDFLKALNRQGVTGGSKEKKLLTSGELKNITKEYQARYGNDNGSVPVTYQVFFAKASRKK